MLSVFVHGDPKPKGSKRAFVVKGRAVVVDASKDTKSWEGRLVEEIVARGEGVDRELYDKPVDVSLLFHLRRPKSAKKRRWPHVKPDIDKLCRTVLDALVTAGVIRDDAQVVSLSADKQYDDRPGVLIDVERLDG